MFTFIFIYFPSMKHDGFSLRKSGNANNNESWMGWMWWTSECSECDESQLMHTTSSLFSCAKLLMHATFIECAKLLMHTTSSLISYWLCTGHYFHIGFYLYFATSFILVLIENFEFFWNFFFLMKVIENCYSLRPTIDNLFDNM